MKHSESLDKLFPAMAMAWAKFPAIELDSKGYNYTYASLGAVIKVVRPILGAQGLFIFQFPLTDDAGRIGVETIIGHKSGQMVSSEYFLAAPVPGDRKNPVAQQAGSLSSYAKRYALVAALCLWAGEDDDAAYAPPAKKAPAQKKAPAKKAEPSVPAITPAGEWVPTASHLVDLLIEKTEPFIADLQGGSDVALDNQLKLAVGFFGGDPFKMADAKVQKLHQRLCQLNQAGIMARATSIMEQMK
jgi:hypothetical protein